jgi:hypothetical protein
MKTKTLFLFCLFLGIQLVQLSAQTKSMVFKGSLVFNLELPVYCDFNGTEVDRVLLPEFDYHNEVHFVNGMPVWATGWYKGECYSKITGEVFTYNEVDRRYLFSGTTYTLHYNLKGNQGNHYVGIMTVEFSDNILILHPNVIKAMCVANGNK